MKKINFDPQGFSRTLKGPFILDFSGCKDREDVKKILREGIGFDGCTDSTEDIFSYMKELFRDAAAVVRIYGAERIKAALGEEIKPLFEVFERIGQGCEGILVEYIE